MAGIQQQETHKCNFRRIDDFWLDVSKMNDSIGNPKFAKLSTLALCLFVLPHGNSDPERGFSMNKHFLKAHGTSLMEDTITALRLIKDVILLYSGVTNIDVSMEFITGGQSGRTSYKAYLKPQKLEN